MKVRSGAVTLELSDMLIINSSRIGVDVEELAGKFEKKAATSN